jgi:hypothetical protein
LILGVECDAYNLLYAIKDHSVYVFYLQVAEMDDICTNLNNKSAVKQEPSENQPMAFPEEYIIKQERDEEGTFSEVKLKRLKVR